MIILDDYSINGNGIVINPVDKDNNIQTQLRTIIEQTDPAFFKIMKKMDFSKSNNLRFNQFDTIAYATFPAYMYEHGKFWLNERSFFNHLKQVVDYARHYKLDIYVPMVENKLLRGSWRENIESPLHEIAHVLSNHQRNLFVFNQHLKEFKPV